MAERVVFLDRDNTIIDNDGYLGDPSKVRLLPGAATALAALRALGYRLIVVSNQSGVARGMFNEAAVEAVNQEMCRQLKEQANAYIDASYYCPYHPDAVVAEYRADHDWRKPKPGMLLQAATDFSVDLAQSWTIGDMPRDIAAGAAAGTRTILLRDPDHPAPENETNALPVSPHFIVRSLADAARIIVREGKTLPPQPMAATPPAPVPTAPLIDPQPAAIPTPITPEAALPDTSPASTAVSEAAATAPISASLAMNEEAIAGAILSRLEAAMDARLAQATPAAAVLPTSARFEKSIEDLVTQIRQQNRHAELIPEFSLANFAALIVQGAAVISLAMAVMDLFLTLVPSNDWIPFFKSQNTLGHGIIWGLVAVSLQGMVLSLLLYVRRK